MTQVKVGQMEVTIREYRTSDFEICRAIYGELSQHYAEIYEDPAIAGEDPGRGFEPYLNNPRRQGIWVAEVDGLVVGIAGLLIHPEEGGEVEPVVVSLPYRSRGIGSMLTKHVVEEARKAEVRFLSVRPTARNIRAISLYVRLGFDLVGQIDLFQDLSSSSGRKWKPGIEVHGNKLRY
jgi:ribosomal protein S18 acetylase RimI-like enzyme